MAQFGLFLLCAAFLVSRAIDGVHFHLCSISDDVCGNQNTSLLDFVAKSIGILHCSVICARTPNCSSFCFWKGESRCILKNADISTETNVGEKFQYWCLQPQKDCPDGFAYQGSAFNSCYKFETVHKQQPENASLICQAEGGHLVYLETTEERDHLQGLINNSTDLKEANNFWIGGVKDGATWRWGCGGVAISESIKPDAISTSHTHMKMKGSASYKLVTAKGIGTTGFVCEVDKT